MKPYAAMRPLNILTVRREFLFHSERQAWPFDFHRYFLSFAITSPKKEASSMHDHKRQLMYTVLERHKSELPKHTLSREQRRSLEELPIEVFFSVSFLARALSLDSFRRGALHSSAPVIWHCAKVQWPEMKTFGDFIKKLPSGVNDLVEMSGFGPGAFILLADSLRVFGYDLEYHPQYKNRLEDNEENIAHEALKRIGLA
jgi:hypothetical protein